MKLITFETIKKIGISPCLCYDWVEEMIITKDKVILPPKISMKPLDGVFCNVMPCVLSAKNNTSWGG